MRENIGLLAYSPLAMGMLTGKYDSGPQRVPRRNFGWVHVILLGRLGGFMSSYWGVQDSWMDCNKTARELGITPTEFALKFVESRAFVTSKILMPMTLSGQMTWKQRPPASRLHATYRCPMGR